MPREFLGDGVIFTQHRAGSSQQDKRGPDELANAHPTPESAVECAPGG
ncbi:hypothetical protein ACAG26_26625 [Mycobacterium sp. pUA109]